MGSLPGGTSRPSGNSLPGGISVPAVSSFPDGPVAPNQITSATRRFWHDAQDTATYSGGTWTDKFGNGYDFAQGVAGKQPTADTAAFGGRTSLRFTRASSQELVLTDGTRATNFIGGTDVAYEWWMVIQFANVTLTSIYSCVDSSASAITYAMSYVASSALAYERRDGVGADTNRVQSGLTPLVNTPYIMRMRYTGTNAAWTVNGVNLTTAGSSDVGAMSVDRIILGAFGNGAGAHNSFLDGWIGTSIGLTGSLSATEAEGMTNFLKARWWVVF